MRSVATILVPDNYSRVELGADLALLRLSSPAKLGPFVRPVCLPRASHLFAHGTACWATGWGDVQEAGEWGTPPPLQVWALGALKAESSSGLPPQKLSLRVGPRRSLGDLVLIHGKFLTPFYVPSSAPRVAHS